mgnify:CR=1 FL=1
MRELLYSAVQIVMKNREVLTLDEERIRFEAEKHMNDIIKRAY